MPAKCHTNPSFVKLQLLNFNEIFELQVCKLMHRYRNNFHIGIQVIKKQKKSKNTLSKHAIVKVKSKSTQIIRHLKILRSHKSP